MQAPEVPQPTGRAVSPALEKDKFLYRPASWFEPLDLAAMFGRSATLEVELGCGDGSFLVAWAGLHPDRNFIGVERLLGRIRKLDRKAQRAGLENIRGLRIEAGYCIEYLLPPESVDRLHVYFPDPWPKRRHHKHRLVNEHFVTLTCRVLRPGGTVHFRTDNDDYFTRITEVCGDSSMLIEEPTPPELAAVLTDFEREFVARGEPIHRVSYRRR